VRSFFPAAQAKASSSVTSVHNGNLKLEPIAARRALGDIASAEPSDVMTPATPAASAALMTAPRFDGLLILLRNTTAGVELVAIPPIVSGPMRGRSAIATIPCGLFVSAIDCSVESETSKMCSGRSHAAMSGSDISTRKLEATKTFSVATRARAASLMSRTPSRKIFDSSRPSRMRRASFN
jgi:hypothetical protein